MAVNFVNAESERIVRARANGRCEQCGMKSGHAPGGTSYLSFHHKHGLDKDAPEDLEYLCTACHGQRHRKNPEDLVERFTATTYLNRAENEALIAACEVGGLSRSEIIRRALRGYLGV